MNVSLRLSALPMLALAASAWAAPSVTGNWTGHWKIPPDPQHQKQIDSLAKLKTTLAIKADHTYVLSLQGAQKQATGTWSQNGSTLTFVSSDKTSQKFTLSSNGKQLSLVKAKNAPYDLNFTR